MTGKGHSIGLRVFLRSNFVLAVCGHGTCDICSRHVQMQKGSRDSQLHTCVLKIELTSSIYFEGNCKD